jgi:hypothetical protein
MIRIARTAWGLKTMDGKIITTGGGVNLKTTPYLVGGGEWSRDMKGVF